jgi:hypothetical protein
MLQPDVSGGGTSANAGLAMASETNTVRTRVILRMNRSKAESHSSDKSNDEPLNEDLTRGNTWGDFAGPDDYEEK